MFFDLIKEFSLEILLVVLVFQFLLFILFLINTSKQTKLMKKFNNLIKGQDGASLEDKILLSLRKQDEHEDSIAVLKKQNQELKRILARCIQFKGVIRFNAYDEMGSDLSYSVALLDEKGDGVVLSSLYGRHESRTYAKPIAQGESTYLLSEEEKEAIAKALQVRK